jgi:hypothetical protein
MRRPLCVSPSLASAVISRMLPASTEVSPSRRQLSQAGSDDRDVKAKSKNSDAGQHVTIQHLQIHRALRARRYATWKNPSSPLGETSSQTCRGGLYLMYLEFPIHGRHSNGICCGISIAAAPAIIQSFDWGALNIKMNAPTLCRAAILRLFALILQPNRLIGPGRHCK